jgi:glycosyltransferase involved in cell wall biosynthesis
MTQFKNIKIAIIDECFQTKRHGGTEIWTKRMLDYFTENAIHHELFSFTKGIKTRIPDKLKLLPFFRELSVFPFLASKYLPGIEQKFDIIHFTSTATPVWYNPQTPTVVSVHYLISRQCKLLRKYLPLKYKALFNPLLIKMFEVYEQRAFSRVSRITVCKESFKNYLITEYHIPREKITTIKYGVDVRLFQPKRDWSKNERKVLYIGRGSVAKGFDTLVEAADKINGEIVAVASRIPRFCRKMIQKKKNMTIKSNLSEFALLSLYRSSSVFVMPSLSEGSPLVTLEAMASGLPVVCTPEGSGDYIRNDENGFIFSFKDSNMLAERVNYLLDHGDVAQKFGQRNRVLVEKNYSIPFILSQTTEIYKNLVSMS